MILTSARALFGLNAFATHTNGGATGRAKICKADASKAFKTADVGYTVRAIFAGSGNSVTLNLLTGAVSGATSWVAGTAQVDTNTVVAAGGCTTNGTMTLVVTSAGMTGSPLNVAVALTTAAHTTATLIATAARAALNANAVVAARFTIGGSGAIITLTRKRTDTFSVPGGLTVDLYAANDATLNLNIPAGLGVTVSATSTDTTAGVVTSGLKIYGNGVDFEGVALPAIITLYGYSVETVTGGVNGTGSTDDFRCGSGEMILRARTNAAVVSDTSILLTATAAATDLSVNVIGRTT